MLRVIGLLGVVLVLPPGVAQACSCLEYLTQPDRALERSGLVFSGEVISIEVVRLPVVTYMKNEQGVLIPSQHMERRAIVTLKTLRVWKGQQTEQYRILAGAPPESPLPPGLVVVDCQQHLEVGKRYLIFATEGYPEADPCAPTGELEKSETVIAALDRYLALRKKGGGVSHTVLEPANQRLHPTAADRCAGDSEQP